MVLHPTNHNAGIRPCGRWSNNNNNYGLTLSLFMLLSSAQVPVTFSQQRIGVIIEKIGYDT